MAYNVDEITNMHGGEIFVKILGIDPANYVMGYGYVDYNLNTKEVSYLRHGFIRETSLHYPETLFTQTNRLRDLLKEDRPEVVAIEAPKDNQGFQSHQRQCELIGTIKRLLVELGIPFIEIPPNTMKKVITGNGWATKEEVARVISDKFNIPFEDLIIVNYYKQGIKKGQIKSYMADGSDALGLAVCFPTYYGRVRKLDYNGR
jgi:crossover junction endodeoxyribonuclease RuvC